MLDRTITLIILNFLVFSYSFPTLSPTFSSSNQYLVELVVQVTLENVQSSAVGDSGKDVIVTTVKDSLVCCKDDFSVIITNYYAGSAVTGRKLSENTPFQLSLRRGNLATIPTTIFNMTVSFLYTDMEYDDAFDAFNFMSSVLVKNMETGGFEKMLDVNKQSCVSSTCAALANAGLNGYYVSNNPYADPDNHERNDEDDDGDGAMSSDGMFLAVGMSITMIFTLLVFFYVQYCWVTFHVMINLSEEVQRADGT